LETNRQRGMEFKNRVLIYLLQQGLYGARIPSERNRLSDYIGDQAPQTDLVGMEPWIIDVRTSQGADFSAALTYAATCAETAESDWYVTVQSRKGWPVEQSYAVMPLALLSRIFKGEAPPRPQLGIAENPPRSIQNG
jgi:hypothetical protein